MLLIFGAMQGCWYDTSMFKGGTITEGKKGDHFRYMVELREFDAAIPGETQWLMSGMPTGKFAIVLVGECQTVEELRAKDRKITVRFARKDWKAAQAAGGSVASEAWSRSGTGNECRLSPREFWKRPLESQLGYFFFIWIDIEGEPLSQSARLRPRLIWAQPFYSL